MTQHKFEFVLDDQDAENFIGIIQDNIVNMMAKRITAGEQERKWLTGHIKYLNELKQKIIDGHRRF